MSGPRFKITFIDLANKPEWFLKLSPLGKVPILRTGDTVIFESAVINEYIDETTTPQMHPADPLKRAHNRGWIEFGSQMLGYQYRLMVAQTEADFKRWASELVSKLKIIEKEVVLPYFNGDSISLVDTALAPLLMRLDFVLKRKKISGWDKLKTVETWKDNLLKLDSVQNSVPKNFENQMEEHLADHGSLLTPDFDSD